MSKNTTTNRHQFSSLPFQPAFSSPEETIAYLSGHSRLWDLFCQFPKNRQQELLGFCIGKNGLCITYDSVFQRIFDPDIHRDRLESLICSILNKNMRIIAILPRNGNRLLMQGSLIIMDILVQLEDGSYADIEMQKTGYKFPLARADCYSADIIMRQYSRLKEKLGNQFDFGKMQKVCCIVLMEKSPKSFSTKENAYIHRRSASFDTGIYQNVSGLHEDIFICLDIFHSIAHNITKDSSLKDAWLTFLSTANISIIQELTSAFPMFASIYQEITDFMKQPEELMNMLSEELYIMDHNTERLMVTEL